LFVYAVAYRLARVDREMTEDEDAVATRIGRQLDLQDSERMGAEAIVDEIAATRGTDRPERLSSGPMRRCVGFLMASLVAGPSAQAASAITNVTLEVAKGLGSIPPGSLVVASPIASDVPATKADEIALRIASVLAGKLPGQARAHSQALTLSGAHAAAKGKPAVVFLRLEIARGELRVTADAIPVVANGWDRIRLPPPPPIAHAFSSAPIDAEIRGALTPIPLEQAKQGRM
jgi:hypothetical protein